MESYKKIAQILRTDKDIIRLVEEKLSATTGKKDVIEKIAEENESAMKSRLNLLGINKNSLAREIYHALLFKIKADDNRLFETMGKPSASNPKDWERILVVATKLANSTKGLFLKENKAAEFLEKEPPQEVMKILGYQSVSEMLAKENLFEIYASLRFIEGNDWLNKVFFKQYERLKPSDFEKRAINTRSLGERWLKLSEGFVKKKHHNISHLKEMGLIFTLPIPLDISGELLRNFSLILHYFNEIPFYSSLFEKFTTDEENFARNLISLLRGDVWDERLPASLKSQWLIIQRYLAKDDPYDWRLFEPHIDPETIHWERAEELLIKYSEISNHFVNEISFWKDLNWVGDYFMTESGIGVLVSFNLVDTAMSLVKKEQFIKYLYHHQESLWNKIFIEYFGEEKMEELIKENIIKGWFEI